LLSGVARAWIVVSLVLGLVTNIANDSKSTPNLSHEGDQPQSAQGFQSSRRPIGGRERTDDPSFASPGENGWCVRDAVRRQLG
jgi:hypothetical protein